MISDDLTFKNGLRLISSSDRTTKLEEIPSKTELNMKEIQSLIDNGIYTAVPEIFAKEDNDNMKVFENSLPGPQNLKLVLKLFVKLKDVSLRHVKIEKDLNFQINLSANFDRFYKDDKENRDSFGFIYKGKIN